MESEQADLVLSVIKYQVGERIEASGHAVCYGGRACTNCRTDGWNSWPGMRSRFSSSRWAILRALRLRLNRAMLLTKGRKSSESATLSFGVNAQIEAGSKGRPFQDSGNQPAPRGRHGARAFLVDLVGLLSSCRRQQISVSQGS